MLLFQQNVAQFFLQNILNIDLFLQFAMESIHFIPHNILQLNVKILLYHVILCYDMNKSIQQKPPQSSYHPFTIPPSLQLCLKHRECSQFGVIKQENSENVCPCCNSPPRQPLKIGCKIEQIYEVSQPAGYYFTYIKLITCVLIIIMLITGIYTLIQIINQCSSSQQQQQGLCLYVYGIPIPKIHIFFKTTLIILNLAVLIVLYLFCGYLFFRHSYLHQKNLSGHEKASDCSVMLSGFVHGVVGADELRVLAREWGVCDVIYTHKVKEYLGWLGEKSVLDALLVKYRNWNSPKAEKVEKKIKKLENLMLHTKNKLTLGQDVEFRTDKIILTFGQASQKKIFQQQYGLTMAKNIYHTFCGGSPLMLNGIPIYVEPLGQPNQIIWQNLQITAKSRYLRVFVSNIVTIGLLFGSFVMVAYLTKGEEDQSAVGDALMSLLFAVLIEVVNEVLGLLIDFFTTWQGRYTLTGQISMKLYKNCAGFFLNTTLLPFFLFILDWFDPEQDDIIRNILSLFFISNLISPYIGLLLQPQYLSKQYHRHRIARQGKNCIMTQIKANSKYQKMDFMLDDRYGLVCQLVMNCMFYAAIFPIGIGITVVGMGVTYWSSKWWIVRYCSLTKFSYKLGRHIVIFGNYVQNIISCLMPTVYAFGYAANLYMVPKQVQFDRSYSIYIAIATIPISLLFILFGESFSRRWITTHRQSVLEPSLSKHKNSLSYKSLNPTSFIHGNLSPGMESKDIWSKLVSYVTAKESGILVQDFDQVEGGDGDGSRGSSFRSSFRESQLEGPVNLQ